MDDAKTLGRGLPVDKAGYVPSTSILVYLLLFLLSLFTLALFLRFASFSVQKLFPKLQNHKIDIRSGHLEVVTKSFVAYLTRVIVFTMGWSSNSASKSRLSGMV